MKNAFATAALILATAGTAAFAQGMEGQQVGYTADNADAAYSTPVSYTHLTLPTILLV